MQQEELLTVADTFQLSHVGLTLMPDFAVPNGTWKSRSAPVVVITPDGQELETTAQFNMTHFNIPDPSVSVEKRWRVVISIPTLHKQQVPIGSRVMVSSEVKNALLSGGEA